MDDAGSPADRDSTSVTKSFAQLAAPPIFIVGHHRSGTTWVYDLLTHPREVAGVLETWLFTPSLGLGSLFHEAHWGDAHLSRVQKLVGAPVGLAQLVDRDAVLAACRELAERWLANAIQPSHKYLVEKTPDHLFAVDLISEIFPTARFISVIRDGRDVAVSVQAAYPWNPAWRLKGIGAIFQLARRWSYAVHFSESLGERLGPDRYMEVSYEELTARPKETVADLFSFCGIEASEAMISAAIAANDFRKNYGGGEDQFRRKGAVGEWQDRFGIVSRFLFARGAGATLVRRGYARSRSWWVRT